MPGVKSLHYRKSVYVTCSVLLAEFEDTVLEAQTAASDFSISDLVAGDRPVTLYILARPMDARRLRRVFKLILTQMVDLLTRSEEYTSELQSLMRISYAVFCLKKKNIQQHTE